MIVSCLAFLLTFLILIYAFQYKKRVLLVLALGVLSPSLLPVLRMFEPGSSVWLTAIQAVYLLTGVHLMSAAVFMNGGLAHGLRARRARPEE